MSVSARPPAVAVMAKVPGAVAVKTRLHPLLGADMATRLHECFLRDRLDSLTTVERIERIVAFTPADAAETMARLVSPAVTLIAQRGDDLGARLDHLVGDLLAAGHTAAIAMDTDSPTLPVRYVAEAARQLERGVIDVVVGPCDDGGYYLIGVRARHAVLFDGIPWSTDRVLAATLERARRHRLCVHRLPSWFDVDTPADLVRLRDQLAALPSGPLRTRALLDELTAGGALPLPS